MFKDPIRRVIEGENNVDYPFAIGEQLLDWSNARCDYFRENVRLFSKEWLSQELECLSPYLLPIPINSQETTQK